MKTIRKHLDVIGAAVAVTGILIFVGCLAASAFVWHPGTPSATAQALTVCAACGLPLSLIGFGVATLKA